MVHVHAYQVSRGMTNNVLRQKRNQKKNGKSKNQKKKKKLEEKKI